MFKSYGYIEYDPRTSTKFDKWWMVLKTDVIKRKHGYSYVKNGLSAYYRSLIMKERSVIVNSKEWLKANDLDSKEEWPLSVRNVKVIRSAWGPHISVVRGEEPKNKKYWGKYQGERVEFSYDPRYINTNGKHWWFRIKSDRLLEIRRELGISPYPIYWSKGQKRNLHFHLTLGTNAEAPSKKEYNKKKRR